MKYKIVFNSGHKSIKGLSFDDALKYQKDNLDKLNTFSIVEEVEEEKVKKALKKDFVMTDMQRAEVERGEKELKYSEELNEWYLVVKKHQEGFSSLNRVKESEINERKRRTIRQLVKAHEQSIFDSFSVMYPETTPEEFKKLLYNEIR